MKIFSKYLVAWVAILLPVYASAQWYAVKDKAEIPKHYLTYDEVVNSYQLLPPYPEEGSERYLYDVERYKWGLSMRDTERGRQAIVDSYTQPDSIAKNYSEAFGTEISWEKTPAIYYVMARMIEDAGTLACGHAKEHYMRKRPFVVFDQHTPLLEQEAALIDNGSYPSGHTTIGFAVASVLAEINPARRNELMKKGYEMGESRVILGFHFDSDVEAGRLTGCMLVPILHTNEEFLRDMAEAKAEFARLQNASDRKPHEEK